MKFTTSKDCVTKSSGVCKSVVRWHVSLKDPNCTQVHSWHSRYIHYRRYSSCCLQWLIGWVTLVQWFFSKVLDTSICNLSEWIMWANVSVSNVSLPLQWAFNFFLVLHSLFSQLTIIVVLNCHDATAKQKSSANQCTVLAFPMVESKCFFIPWISLFHEYQILQNTSHHCLFLSICKL